MYLNSTLEHECWVILTHTMNKYHLVVMSNRIFMVKKKKLSRSFSPLRISAFVFLSLTVFCNAGRLCLHQTRLTCLRTGWTEKQAPSSIICIFCYSFFLMIPKFLTYSRAVLFH